MLTFWNSELNNSASPRILNFIKFYICLCVCSYFKSLLTIILFAKSPVFSPIFYKFIILGSLGSYSNHLGLELQIVSLQVPLPTSPQNSSPLSSQSGKKKKKKFSDQFFLSSSADSALVLELGVCLVIFLLFLKH